MWSETRDSCSSGHHLTGVPSRRPRSRSAPVGRLQPTEWILSVKNTGAVDGNIAVLCYVAAGAVHHALHGAPALPPPLRSVFDFGRVEGLAPGGTRLLSFALDPAGRALIGGNGVWFNPAGSSSCGAARLVLSRRPSSRR